MFSLIRRWRHDPRPHVFRAVCAVMLGGGLGLMSVAYWLLERNLALQSESAARVIALGEQKARSLALVAAVERFASERRTPQKDALRHLLLEIETAHNELQMRPKGGGALALIAIEPRLAAHLGEVTNRALALALAAKAMPEEMPLREALAALVDGELLPALSEAKAAQEAQTERRLRRLVLAKFIVLAAIVTMVLAESLFVVRPLTRALDRAAENMRRLAEEDRLTGLATRGVFEQRARIAATRARHERRTLTVLLVDVDRLRAVNHAFGAAAGDAVIAHVAAKLARALPPAALAARWDGEEMIVLLPQADLQEALQFAETVRQAVAESACLVDAVRPLYVTASVGVALFDPARLDLGDAIMRAEHHLRRAKLAGRNRVLFGLEDAAGGILAA